MGALSPLFHRLAAILLTYLGLSVSSPAPDGWQAFHGPGFTLHLPPGWQRLPVDEQKRLTLFKFADAQDTQRVMVQMGDGKRTFLSDINILRHLEAGFRAELVSALDRRQPPLPYSLSSPVYDAYRQRLWYRLVLSRPAGQSPQLDLLVLQSTQQGVLDLDGFGNLGDEAFEATFQKIVDSFEMDQSLLYRKPYFWLNHVEENLSPRSALRPAERRLLTGSLLFFLPFIFISLILPALFLLDAAFLRSRMKRALLRRLPRLGLRRETASPRKQRWLRYIPLPWSLGLQLVLSVTLTFGMVSRFLDSPQLYGPIFLAPCYLVGYGLLLLTMACHYTPNASRRLKYELLAAALAVLAVPGTLADPVSQATILGRNIYFIRGFYTGNYLVPALFFLIAGLIVGRLLWSGDETASARRASLLYRFTYGVKLMPGALVATAPLIPAGGAFITGFLSLVALYLIGRRALENPILYLRSFHDRNTPVVLAKIVMPVAFRFAPVLAAAHAKLQPPEELYRRTNFLTAAHLTIQPDTAWQEWILGLLPHCQAVLIDIGAEGPSPRGSLLWELENARKVLARERILVLAEEGAPPLDLPEVQVLRYRLGWRGQRAARKALRRWLKGLRTAPVEKAAPSPLTVSPPA
jgi:hypothetical protein